VITGGSAAGDQLALIRINGAKIFIWQSIRNGVVSVMNSGEPMRRCDDVNTTWSWWLA
jgi:hypothetical protein